jgi:hypothetical protein
MRELHIHSDLLGSTILNARGDKATIMALWLEDVNLPDHPPTRLIALIKNSYGRFFRLKLPDIEWEYDETRVPELPPHDGTLSRIPDEP